MRRCRERLNGHDSAALSLARWLATAPPTHAALVARGNEVAIEEALQAEMHEAEESAAASARAAKAEASRNIYGKRKLEPTVTPRAQPDRAVARLCRTFDESGGSGSTAGNPSSRRESRKVADSERKIAKAQTLSTAMIDTMKRITKRRRTTWVGRRPQRREKLASWGVR